MNRHQRRAARTIARLMARTASKRDARRMIKANGDFWGPRLGHKMARRIQTWFAMLKPKTESALPDGKAPHSYE